MTIHPLRGGEDLEPYFRAVHRRPIATADEVLALAHDAALGSAAARERLVLAHLPLVARLACGYVGYGLPLADLIAEGNLGLLRAAELFNPTFGTAFSTYATLWIKQRFHRAITAQAQVVRIPVWRSQRLRKLDRLHAALSAELGVDAPLTELARRLGIPEEDLARIAEDRLRVESLHHPDAGDETRDWIDPAAAAPGDALCREELLEEIGAALAGLDDTELQIVSRKFGLLDEPPESFREMAPHFGRSREWIRRAGERALAKLAASLRQVGDLPRSLVRAREATSRCRLERLRRVRTSVIARVSLLKTALTHEAEILMLLIP